MESELANEPVLFQTNVFGVGDAQIVRYEDWAHLARQYYGLE